MTAELYSREMEIRHLPIHKIQEIVKMIDDRIDDSVLSLVMGNIVKDLEDNESELRFNSADIDQLREHSYRHDKSAISVLIDEWSTMGKIRPKLKHLLALLVKCQLFKAAEYVADLIGENHPSRPNTGPATRVDISLVDENIEEVINNLEYPFSSIHLTKVNRINIVKPTPNTLKNLNFLNGLSDNENKPRTSTTAAATSKMFEQAPTEVSDLIKFSTSFSTQIPLVIHETVDIPLTVNSDDDISNSTNIPALSGLMSSSKIQSESENLPACIQSMEMQSTNQEIPNFTGLLNASDDKTLSSVVQSQSMSESYMSSTN